MHDDGPLAVAQIVDILSSHTVDVSEHSRKIVVGHVLEGKLPKLFALIGVQLHIFSRMLVSSAVAQPDVKTQVGQHETRSLILIINDPGVRWVQEPVLKQDWFEALANLRPLFLDSEHPQNIAIFSSNIMILDWVVEIP